MNFPFAVQFNADLEEIQQRQQLNLQRRVLRDQTNPFEIPESEFRESYRLPKVVVIEDLIPAIEPHANPRARMTHVPVHLKVLLTLHIISYGGYQRSAGKNFHCPMSQSAVSKVFKEIIGIMANQLFTALVKFSTTNNDRQQVKRGFEEKFNFPNVLGAIDCTHIAIVAPKDVGGNPATNYYNRKGYYSVNVQAVCDSNLELLSVNARYPGSTHDAAIWSMSTINRHLQNKFNQGDHASWLLGDSGYPLTPWLMTPILDAAENSPEARYTTKHCRVRNVIERCFGVWKQRFRCLLKHRVLHYDHGMAASIIYSCAALHNMCVQRNIGIEEYDEIDVNDPGRPHENVVDREAEIEDEVPIDGDILTAGRRIRARLLNTLENV